MILKHVKALNGIKIVLASASPRRKEILGNLGLSVEVVPSTFEEDLPHAQYTPAEYATATAKCKALDVANTCQDAHLIIASDTVVEQGGHILEKAADVAQATDMLTMLSGDTHQVHTAVSAEEVQAYIETGAAWGKAGAYGIQGAAGSWVEGIDGCYFNVMGFPVHRFSATVAQLIDEGFLKV